MNSHTSPQIVAGVRAAFAYYRRYDHPRGGIGLTETQVLRGLVIARLVSLPDASDPRHQLASDLEVLSGVELYWGSVWSIRQNCGTLGDLVKLTRAEVLALPRIGPRGLARIELALARLGLMLRDGDSALIARECPVPAAAPPRQGRDNVIRGAFG